MMVSGERFQKAKIIFRKDHTEDLWSIRVRPESQLAFKPGQYATLGIEEEGRVVERSYSICSSPHEPEVEFFFELVMRGRVTPPLYHRNVGDILLMRRSARGNFTLDSRNGGHRNHLLVCTVTGVAPYVSMARALARDARAGHHPGGPETPNMSGVYYQSWSATMDFPPILDKVLFSVSWAILEWYEGSNDGLVFNMVGPLGNRIEETRVVRGSAAAYHM